MRKFRLSAMLRNCALVSYAALSIAMQAGSAEAKPTFKSIDVPGAASTYAYYINDSGTIAGQWIDTESHLQHGFLRAADGSVTPFDAPGGAEGTIPKGINAAGSITGFFLDDSYNSHGFLRAADGTITKFNVPGAREGTYPLGINAEGTVTGFYASDSVSHGFQRTSDGVISTIDVPDAYQTFPRAISDKGTVAGDYIDQESLTRGFLLSPNGRYKTFGIPKRPNAVMGVTAINYSGEIVGFWQANYRGSTHAFLRAGKTIFSFDLGSGSATIPSGLNTVGEIVGYFDDSDGSHGFKRAPDGKVTTFDFPNSIYTIGEGINDKGEIAGYYESQDGAINGFLLKQ